MIMPIFYIEESFMEHPCMTKCEATNRTVIRDKVWERGGAPERGGGGGGGEKDGLWSANNHL